jgi:hypothetical protein
VIGRINRKAIGHINRKVIGRINRKVIGHINRKAISRVKKSARAVLEPQVWVLSTSEEDFAQPLVGSPGRFGCWGVASSSGFVGLAESSGFSSPVF